ncbi:hypothetical protein [Pedobacter sp. SYSU D00535]|uniref:hypothetical protein n=1 Tax=Pedobacter sp. SYSU D00535 TaxID=2810308 RepID=UPI001A969F28|nr:hypothetical protein [Pedobacter sp. SYSU D00535]
MRTNLANNNNQFPYQLTAILLEEGLLLPSVDGLETQNRFILEVSNTETGKRSWLEFLDKRQEIEGDQAKEILYNLICDACTVKEYSFRAWRKHFCGETLNQYAKLKYDYYLTIYDQLCAVMDGPEGIDNAFDTIAIY